MGLRERHAIADALMTVLDAETAEAVIEHRKVTIKKPLTLRAAQLLAKEMAKCVDPNAAADEMIMRAWVGFKAEWLRNSAPRSALPEKPKSQGQRIYERMMSNDDDRSGTIQGDFLRH